MSLTDSTTPTAGRQPVLGAGQAAAAATVLAGLLVSWLSRHGLLVPGGVAEPIADLIEVGIVALLGAGSSLWAALWARRRVTPSKDPRDDAGRSLRPDAGRPLLTDDQLRELARALAGLTGTAAPVPASTGPGTEPVPVVDVAALRREYRLD